MKIIQMISLPVSFLRLAWTFTVVDQLIDDGIEMNVKHKVILFLSHVLQLSSRLFAICFFIVSYKWWILLFDVSFWCNFHRGPHLGRPERRIGSNASLANCFLHWIRDEFTVALFSVDNNADPKNQRKKILWLSNVLFVLENVAMILL